MDNYFKYNSTTVAPMFDTPVISVPYKQIIYVNMLSDINRAIDIESNQGVSVSDISGLTDLVQITEEEFNSLKG